MNYLLKLKGYVGGYAFDADYVDYRLSQNKDKEVHILIDSLGGDVGAALSIAKCFRDHGNVTVHFSGLNASAATIASLGAKHIAIDSNAMYLVHKVSTLVASWASMNADQLSAYIENLDKEKKNLEKFDLNVASMYAAKCKKKKEALLSLMKEGAWLTAEEALEWGFVDEIATIENAQEPKLSASMAASLTAEGLPLPPVEMEQDGSRGFADFFGRLAALFASKKQKINTIPSIMKKVYTNICKLLNQQEFTADDGKITVTDVQMQSIEDEMARLQNENAQLTADLADRDAQLAELRKKPAEETRQVNGNGGGAPSESPLKEYADNARQAEELYNLI